MNELIITPNDQGVLLEKGTEKFQLKWHEFWQLCRMGQDIDTKNEIKEFIADSPDECYSFLNSSLLLDKVASYVIDMRISNETTDEIYEALEAILGGLS